MELLLLVVVLVCSPSVQSEETSIPVGVSRRPSSDMYFNNQSMYGIVCDNEEFVNVTYLVSERRCISNEDLFTGNLEVTQCCLVPLFFFVYYSMQYYSNPSRTFN